MKRQAGQSTLEFAVMVIVFIAALISMGTYVKRGIAGRLKSAADSLGEPYDPRHTSSNTNLTIAGNTTITSDLFLSQTIYLPGGNTVLADVLATEAVINQDETDRTGNETVGPLGNRLWDY